MLQRSDEDCAPFTPSSLAVLLTLARNAKQRLDAVMSQNNICYDRLSLIISELIYLCTSSNLNLADESNVAHVAHEQL